MCYRRLIINLTTVKSWMGWDYMDWTQFWYSGEVTCGSSHADNNFDNCNGSKSDCDKD